MRWISLLTCLVVLKFVPQVEPAPASNWSPSPSSTDSSPVTVGMKRSRENGQEAEPDGEPAPKKAFGFEMKLSSNMVKNIPAWEYLTSTFSYYDTWRIIHARAWICILSSIERCERVRYRVENLIYYVTITTEISSRVKITCYFHVQFSRGCSLGISLVFI